MQSQNDNGPSPTGPGGRRKLPTALWYVLAGLAMVLVVNMLLVPRSPNTSIDYSTFKAKIANGDIKRVEIAPDYYLGYTITKEQAQQIVDGKASAPSAQVVYRTTAVQDPSFILQIGEVNGL